MKTASPFLGQKQPCPKASFYYKKRKCFYNCCEDEVGSNVHFGFGRPGFCVSDQEIKKSRVQK